MIPLLLALACKPAPDTDPHDHETGDTGHAHEEPAPLVSPAEAEDLDPDPDVLHVKLTATPVMFSLEGAQVVGYAYNQQIPGPTLRAKRGDTVRVELQNGLDTETTIHWHGLAVPYAMDGATWSEDPVGAGEVFTYEFTVDQVGTFWYHPHFDTEQQVDLGLYGVLVVEDPDEPVADEEVVLVFDSWGESGAHDHGEGSEHPHGFHGGAMDWTVNLLREPVASWTGGSVVRARLVNVSNTGYVAIPGVRVLARDQGLLPEPWEPDVLVLAPGDRAEVEWLPGEEDLVVQTLGYDVAGDASAVVDPQTLFEVRVQEPAPASAGLPWAFSGEAPTEDPGVTDLLYVFEGDPHTGRWLINGERYPDVTVETLPLGAETVVEVRNLSPTHHPFHLHGYEFEVLSIDGAPPPHRLIEDTVDIGVRQTLRLRFLADNPGSWMTHCHILPHAHNGMMTVIDVE